MINPLNIWWNMLKTSKKHQDIKSEGHKVAYYADHFSRVLFSSSFRPLPTVPFVPETLPFLGPQNSFVSQRKRNLQGLGCDEGFGGSPYGKKTNGISLGNGAQKLVGIEKSSKSGGASLDAQPMRDIQPAFSIKSRIALL